MQFAKDFPDQLRAQINISEVVGKNVALKQKGKEFSGLCPFHSEKTPSFTLNDQKGFYHCFGCGAHGDIITFVIEKEGLGFKDAIIKLAEDFGIKIPIIQNTSQDNKRIEKIDRDYLLLETACQFFENNLFSNLNSKALQYLYNRGLNNQNIKEFRIGFAIDDYESLIKHLKSQGFNDSELLASGIINKNNSNKLYDKFRNRIIFPITDKKDRIIAFGGRIMGDGQPKYLNSSETGLFKKGENLYNYSLSRKSIYDKKFAIVVEGYMDVIALSIKGIKNIVAPLGTAMTVSQITSLFKITSDIVICFDGDKAGINAMRRVIDTSLPIINHSNLLRFVILPNHLDPDDFIRDHGVVAMENLLVKAVNLSQALFDFERSDLKIDGNNTNILPETKAKLEARLLEKVDLINDPNNKKHFLQYYKTCLFELGRKRSKSLPSFLNNNKSNLVKESDKQSNYAVAIIIILSHNPDLINYEDEFCTIRDLDFNNDELSNLKENLIDIVEQNKDADYSHLKLIIEKQILNNLDSYSPNKSSYQDFSKRFLSQDAINISNHLRIFLLKYFYEEVELQYQALVLKVDELDTNQIHLMDGKQKELFHYKTLLEKKIVQLESDLV